MLKRLIVLLLALACAPVSYGADVSAACKDWSSTSNSNNPSGTTSIGSGLDDNLREIQGAVIRCLSHKGSDIASAGTTDLGAVEGLFHDITGTTTITSFGTVRAGLLKIIKFEGALTLTHNATSLILPGAGNITTADGDVAILISEGSGNWRVLSYQYATNGAVPIGSVMPFAGTTEPAGWLFAYGQAVSRTTYARLFAVISTTYGTGDGSTTFNLPDLRGRVVAGQDDMGGSSANRLTDQSGGLNGDTLGATGGSETHTLTQAQLPSYNLSLAIRSIDNAAGSSGAVGSSGTNTTTSISSGGSGTAHNIVQPTIVLNMIIKF